MVDFYIEIKEDILTILPKIYNGFFRVKVYNEKGLVHKSGLLKNKDFSLKLKDDGFYSVNIKNIFNKVIYSKNFSFRSEETIKEFENFCNNDYPIHNEVRLNPFDYCKTPKPFKDFAIIKNTQLVSDKFLEKYKFSSTKINKNLEIISDKEINKNDVIFSGLMNYENKLIIGEEDLNDDVKKGFCTDNIGYFTYLKRNNNDIEIGNDYLGNGKIFYYQKENTVVISNQYHLLLLILKNLDVELKLDMDVLSTIISFQNEIGVQLMTREREIVGSYLLPIDEKIIITPEKLQFKKKEIYEIIGKNKIKTFIEGIFTDKEKLLDEGIKEIENNIRSP